MTVPNVRTDFVDWRKGRDRYAVWAIDVDLPSVRSASVLMRRLLGDVLLPGYGRQPHVTLAICGFPAVVNTHDDDFAPASFKSQIKALKSASVQPFSIEIGSPASFTSAPFFAVLDGERGVERLRQALGSSGPGERDFCYTPHVTFGLYGAAVPLAPVTRCLQSVALPDLRLTVRRIALMTYDAAVIDGPLQSICEFDLSRQSMRVLDPHAMATLQATTTV